ncbi:hypothetical protein P691DRAFT_765744 [Macrolepiota fuliginosa MF-IS2]|uniref:KOW domain-containing protein n=1 Tax=Macrolepiota fuliginosa MF-IS2 TaxID=1400762 RepID=A0A9P5WZV5_9AGAR|nr:hypothetical protein P691DRAFT_765744 [Macrolepiota fuliginosa MF-IS2]
MKYLNSCQPPFTPQPSLWVHLKILPYWNDLAFVFPCIYYASKTSKTKWSKEKWPKIPLAKLFNPSVTSTISGPSAVQGKTSNADPTIHYSYLGHNFDTSGYLLLTLTPSDYHHATAYPTVNELQQFMNSTLMSLSVKLHEFHLAQGRAVKENDIVRVTSSLHVGQIGTVQGLTSTHAYLLLMETGSAVQVPLHQLCHHYKVSNYVQIKSGGDAGYIGYIVSIDDVQNTAIICNPWSSVSHVTVMLHCLQFADASLHFGKLPPPEDGSVAKLVDMDDQTFAHLEKLQVAIIKGLMKGLFGTVISINSKGLANVEMWASLWRSSGLQQIAIRDMAYELDNNEWYCVNDSNLLEYITVTSAVLSATSSQMSVVCLTTPDPPENPAPGQGCWSVDARDKVPAESEPERPSIHKLCLLQIDV